MGGSGPGQAARAKVSGRLPRTWSGPGGSMPARSGSNRWRSGPGGLRYEGATGSFALFASAGRPSEHTQLAFEVDDIEATVRAARARCPVRGGRRSGMRTVDGIAEVEGNYPSSGATGERAAWFRDSEGNLIGIGWPVRG